LRVERRHRRAERGRRRHGRTRVKCEYITKPELARLWAAARVAWERNGGLAGEARIDALTEAEALELDGMLTWLRRRPRAGATLKVKLDRLDARVRESELAPSLQALLE